MPRRLILILAAVITAALVACSGGDDDGSPTATATSSPGAASAAQSTATPSTADDFVAVLARLGSAQYRVSYTFTMSTAGQDFTGGLVWVRSSDGRERFETSSEQDGEAFDLVVIADPIGGQVTCFEVGGFESCFRGDDGPFAEIPNPTEIIFQNILDPERIDGVRETGKREILGMTATCYEVDAEGGTSEACIADDNLLLSATWTAPNGDGGGFEALEFSTEVSDGDFEPTVPIDE